MMRLLYVLLLILAAAGGAAGTYYFIGKSESANAAVAPPPPPVPQIQPIFVDLPPMSLPVLGNDKVEQMIAFTVSIEVESMDAASFVKAQRPMIADAILQDLYGAIDKGRMMRGKVVDAELLKAELVKTTTRVIGNNLVKQILLQRLSQRTL